MFMLSSYAGTMDPSKKVRFREKAHEYMSRAEAIQKLIEEAKRNGDFHEHVDIAEDSIGNVALSREHCCVFVLYNFILQSNQL